MLVLLSCAKTMSDVSKVKVPLTTVPRFQKEASEIALQMSQFAVGDLERLLRVNAKIAVENYSVIRLSMRKKLRNCRLCSLIRELCSSG